MPTKVHETALIAVDYPKIEITTFKCSNALELVSCIVENPLYAVYVTVPVSKVDLLVMNDV